MNIQLNGKGHTFEGTTVTELVASCKLNPDLIAVELNGAILHREEYDATTLRENDAIEIVRFVGGG